MVPILADHIHKLDMVCILYCQNMTGVNCRSSDPLSQCAHTVTSLSLHSHTPHKASLLLMVGKPFWIILLTCKGKASNNCRNGDVFLDISVTAWSKPVCQKGCIFPLSIMLCIMPVISSPDKDSKISFNLAPFNLSVTKCYRAFRISFISVASPLLFICGLLCSSEQMLFRGKIKSFIS